MKPGVLKIFIFSDEDFSILNFNRLMIKLPIDRRNYVNKFKNYEDKCNSLIAYLLTVYGIKKIFNTELSGLSFSYTNFGKPYFTNYPNIHFNISHIKSKVICAISDNPRGVCKLVGETQLILKRFPEPFEFHRRIMLMCEYFS